LQNAVVQDLVPAQSVHRVIDTGNNMKHSSRQSRSEEKRVFLMVCALQLCTGVPISTIEFCQNLMESLH